MTISALEEVCSDVFERNFDLYRDLSVGLADRIAQLRAGVGCDPAGKETLDAVKSHQRALQTVLELEASLVKRSRSWTNGGGGELDLAAARAEILARLAVWNEER